uniref:Uncharacterized protein n=1 Tax=Rhizophora mucronata TaxID=61149 RepID=A0A2P2P9M0_RHIMU
MKMRVKTKELQTMQNLIWASGSIDYDEVHYADVHS